MIIHEIHDLSNNHVIDLMLQSFRNFTDKAIANYHPEYSDCPGNIFRVLKEGRYNFGHGKYYVVEQNGELMASAGWNEYDLEPSTALVLSRMFVSPSHRGSYILGKEILPKMLTEVDKYSKIWMTVNEHNKSLYKWFERMNENKRPSLFNNWPEIYTNFKPIGKKNVYYTPQYVVELKRENND